MAEDELFQICEEIDIPLVTYDLEAVKRFEKDITCFFSVHLLYYAFKEDLISKEKALISVEKMKTMNTSNISIETEDLFLRSITMEYKEQIFEEFTPEITTYMYPKSPEKIEGVIKFIKKAKKENEEGSNFQTVVLDKETEEFLGCAGLHHIDEPTPELGIWLKKSAHGNGYGMEAMTALKGWADENLDYEYITYPVAEENIPSRKIPENLGGEICDEYDEKNMSGKELHMLEYRIYPDEG
ncbi:MAG: GNAT family N-acetyltransferase [Candidatus Saliniplasma sp.]